MLRLRAAAPARAGFLSPPETPPPATALCGGPHALGGGCEAPRGLGSPPPPLSPGDRPGLGTCGRSRSRRPGPGGSSPCPAYFGGRPLQPSRVAPLAPQHKKNHLFRSRTAWSEDGCVLAHAQIKRHQGKKKREIASRSYLWHLIATRSWLLSLGLQDLGRTGRRGSLRKACPQCQFQRN